MLPISVHDGQNGSIGMLPSMKNGAGETALMAAHEEANPRILARDFRNDLLCPVTAVVVNDYDFPRYVDSVQGAAYPRQQSAEIRRLMKRGNNERQFCACIMQCRTPARRAFGGRIHPLVRCYRYSGCEIEFRPLDFN